MVGSPSRMGLLHRAVRTGLAFSLAVVTPLARADAALVVTRDDGAAGCPDADEMRGLALAAAPSASPPAHAYHVSFARSGASRVADIVDDTTARARHLEDKRARVRPARAGRRAGTGDDVEQRARRGEPPARAGGFVTTADGGRPSGSASFRPPALAGRRRPRARGGLVRPAAPALSGRGGIELARASFGLGAVDSRAAHCRVAGSDRCRSSRRERVGLRVPRK